VTPVGGVLNKKIFDRTLPSSRMYGIKCVLLRDGTVWLEIHYVIKFTKIDGIWNLIVVGRDCDVGDVPELVDPGQETTIQWHKPDRISIHYYICRIFL